MQLINLILTEEEVKLAQSLLNKIPSFMLTSEQKELILKIEEALKNSRKIG